MSTENYRFETLQLHAGQEADPLVLSGYLLENRSNGVIPGQLRLSAGIENIEDIKADLEQALELI